MKLFYSTVSICLFIYSSCCIIDNEKIKVATFRTSFDFAVQDGKPNFKQLFDIKVVEKDNLVLHFVAYPREGVVKHLLADGTYEDGEIQYDTIKTCYIHEKGRKKGLQYDSLSAAFGKKFDADSVLTSFNMGKQKLAENALEHGKLVFSSYDKKTGKLLIEKFFSDKEDDFDSTYRFYDYSMTDMNISIAPQLDKKNGTKAVKLVFITTAKEKPIKTSREEVSTEIIRGEVTNKDEILRWIEKYNKDKINLKQ